MRKMYNSFESCRKYLKIYLYDRSFKKIATTKIDKEDIKVLEKRWYLNKRGYVECKQSKDRFLLHRYIIKAKKGQIVDHINNDKLDNRKLNLRFVNNSQNTINRKKRKDNTSGKTGVYWDKAKNKWLSAVGYNGKFIYLGRYNSKKKAIKVRKDAEKKFFKEYNPIV